MLTPSQMALNHPGCLLKNVLTENPKKYLHPIIQIRSKISMVPKKMDILSWNLKISSNAHETFLFTIRKVSRKKISILEYVFMLLTLKNLLIYSLNNYSYYLNVVILTPDNSKTEHICPLFMVHWPRAF
jgi:hypothetical protein